MTSVNAVARVVGLVLMIFMLPALSAEFAPVRPGIRPVFPADHGAHPAFRTEWWYVTGWLTDDAGVERGFQITFFRVRTGIGEDSRSRFAPRQLLIAHAAIADPARGHLLHAQRSARMLAPLAVAETGRTRVWIGAWRLESDGSGYRAAIADDAFSLTLRLSPAGPPVLNGDAGFSRKAPDPKHASYYYSRPQLGVEGTLRLGQTDLRVTGSAWLDHEWFSELMPERAKGWDWFGLNLHDGGAVMAFRMRADEERAMWLGGTFVPAGGAPGALERDALVMVPQRRWRSPRTGGEYPVEWQLEVAGRRLRIVPLMDDQELDARMSTGAVYWEGAVRVLEDGREVGRGYLEMTGYAGQLRM